MKQTKQILWLDHKSIKYIIMILNANTFFLNLTLFQNYKYGVIILVATSSDPSRIYQIINLFKNILSKLNPFLFFLFCYTIRLTTNYCYLA